ncbi:hypothetical protein [Thermocatellispora tengchongensis]
MKFLVENRFGMLLLVVISLLALYGVAHVTQPPRPSPPPRSPSGSPWSR